MDDLDFLAKPEKPAPQELVALDPAAALEFFRSHGKEQAIEAGEIIFAENQKSHSFLLQRSKMYLLLEGTIDLSVKDQVIGTVYGGEIFGEMASLTQMPRTATASAATDCRVIALDDRQFRNALQEKPEFALMLMVIMTRRLRNLLAELDEENAQAEVLDDGDYPMLGKNLLSQLVDELGNNAVMRYDEGKVIVQAGQPGLFMYIVLEGQVSIHIHGTIVEEIGPGGIFGEMALVERGERLATAIADTDCEVLAVNRITFIDMVRNNPEFGYVMLSTIGERLRIVASGFAEPD